jgi:hypothetical protein
LRRIALFYYRVLIFTLYNFVSTINVKNKPPSSMPNGMPVVGILVVGVKLLIREVLGSFLML